MEREVDRINAESEADDGTEKTRRPRIPAMPLPLSPSVLADIRLAAGLAGARLLPVVAVAGITSLCWNGIAQ